MIASVGISSALFAQSDGASNRIVEKVVVTAERRQVGQTDLPMSISAFTEDNSTEQAIVHFSQLVDTILAKIPGMAS